MGEKLKRSKSLGCRQSQVLKTLKTDILPKLNIHGKLFIQNVFSALSQGLEDGILIVPPTFMGSR